MCGAENPKRGPCPPFATTHRPRPAPPRSSAALGHLGKGMSRRQDGGSLLSSDVRPFVVLHLLTLTPSCSSEPQPRNRLPPRAGAADGLTDTVGQRLGRGAAASNVRMLLLSLIPWFTPELPGAGGKTPANRNSEGLKKKKKEKTKSRQTLMDLFSTFPLPPPGLHYSDLSAVGLC